MEIFRVSFIGHREVERLATVENKVEGLVRDLIKTKKFVEFYIGRNGEFDISAASVIKRNQWMIDNSDLLIAYVNKDFGGAYNTLKHAEKEGVPIINVAKDNQF